MENKLHLPLTYYWFKEIESGRKTCEYRRFTEGWRKRINRLNNGDLLVFHKGYTNRTITRQITRISVVNGWDLPNDVYNYFGCPNEDKFFCIAFKEVV